MLGLGSLRYADFKENGWKVSIGCGECINVSFRKGLGRLGIHLGSEAVQACDQELF